jgi:predicted phosphohydrolase
MLQRNLRELLLQHTDKDVIINGDLFDTFNVPMQDVLEFYWTASKWLQASGSGVLVLGRGNHDWSKDSSKLSSFDFISRLLLGQFGTRVLPVIEPQMIFPGIYMIPHMPNQEQFDLELGRVPADANMVLVHANYDNHFAVESDHSLNVSAEQAAKIVMAGNNPTLVFGHEHQARTEQTGAVVVTGNQWSSSVADCLHNPGGVKRAHIISYWPQDEDLVLTPVTTWCAADSFAEVPWDDISSWLFSESIEFIRVVGAATAEQAPEVIKAIANLRKTSTALVVTNAVKIEGVSDMDELQVSMEDIKSFDVLAYLMENLDAEQGAVVKGLLAGGEASMREAA